ncbi:MAG: YHS domain-containing protein [Anaerolineae bacterium]|nr:YHS domain-containing protein [Anaerolineae bacterium]
MARRNEERRVREAREERAAQREAVQEARGETAFDIVCGRGIRPEEAIASRVYRGETYYFCCRGCAEAFEANPEAYIGEEPIRAYRVEERMRMGPDPERVRQAEEAVARYRAEVSAAEQRTEAIRGNLDRLRRELEQARDMLAQRRNEMMALGRREDEIRSALRGEEQRIVDLERQVERERTEFENAERMLAEARRSEEAMLRRQQAEIGDLEQRERALEIDMRRLEQRVRDLEAEISRVSAEPESERRLTELRNSLRAAEEELDRVRRERRQVTMEGLPAVEGEEPSEFYEARRVERQRRGQGR